MWHRILRLIKIIVWIATAAGFIAGVAQLFEKKTNSHAPKGLYEKYFKRVLDVFLSTGAIILFSPIIVITALLVRIIHGSPILYVQERPGKDEKIFRLYKFRTMKNETNENGELLPDEKRLTKFGIALRRSSIDEILELINILKGDMSIIGPRPLLVQYLPYYTEIERHRHDVRPGLSGLAQVNGRNLVKWDQRLAYDVQYVNNITFLEDSRIVFQTIKKVIFREDIAANTDTVETFLDQERASHERK